MATGLTSRSLRLAGYRRVSHVGAGAAATRSTAPRTRPCRIRAYAEQRGHRVTMLLLELDESGGREDRPILAEAVALIETGKADGLIVAYGSRLMRRRPRGPGPLRARGAVRRGHRPTPPRRPQHDGGPHGPRYYCAVSFRPRHRARDSFRRLKRESVARGVWKQRQCPRGYDRGPGRRLVPNADAPAVLDGFRRRVAGETVLSLAGRLGMTTSGVRQLLRNRVYLGELRDGDEVNPQAHAAIVPADLWRAAQAQRPRPPRRSGGVALLAGLVRCASCGHGMTRSPSPKGDTYRCPTHHSGIRCPAPAGITVPRLEAHVEQVALAALAAVVAEGHVEHENLAELEAAVAAADDELREYVTVTSAVGLDAGAFAAGWPPSGAPRRRHGRGGGRAGAARGRRSHARRGRGLGLCWRRRAATASCGRYWTPSSSRRSAGGGRSRSSSASPSTGAGATSTSSARAAGAAPGSAPSPLTRTTQTRSGRDSRRPRSIAHMAAAR